MCKQQSARLHYHSALLCSFLQYWINQPVKLSTKQQLESFKGLTIALFCIFLWKVNRRGEEAQRDDEPAFTPEDNRFSGC